LKKQTAVGQNLTDWTPFESEVKKTKATPIDVAFEILTSLSERNHIGVRNESSVILVVSECAFANYDDLCPFATAVVEKLAMHIDLGSPRNGLCRERHFVVAKEWTHES
jgi:hypothetical protein